MTNPARFVADADVFHADTCEPLKAAVAGGELAFNALARGAYPGRRLSPKRLQGVMSVGHWDARRDQRWGLDWHRNEGVELTYVARGSLAFLVDGTHHRLSRGSLTVTRPWQLHRVGNPRVAASRLHWVILDLGVRRPHQAWTWPDWLAMCRPDVKELTRMLQHNEQPVWRADAGIERCFERIAAVVGGSSPSRPDESRLRLLLSELLLEVLELLRRQNPALDEGLSSRRRSVELLLASLPRHLDQTWTLDSMAQTCGLGRSRFAHYCCELHNMPPMEYLNRCRIEQACRLLGASPKVSVTDVAFACGFSSSQYFATVFRRFTGASPQTFRRSRSAAPAAVPTSDWGNCRAP